MTSPKSNYISPKEYLALDADGEIVAMAGASREHNLITSHIHVSLANQLRNCPCEIYQSDMRVQTKADSAYRYPNIVVVCADPIFADTTTVSLINPTHRV